MVHFFEKRKIFGLRLAAFPTRIIAVIMVACDAKNAMFRLDFVKNIQKRFDFIGYRVHEVARKKNEVSFLGIYQFDAASNRFRFCKRAAMNIADLDDSPLP